jgi:hypothetical protein
MPSPDLIGSIGQAAGGIAKGVVGYFQNRKANKLLKGLQYPTETMPSALVENQNRWRQLAGQGLPSQQYAQAMRNLQRTQLSSLMAAHDRRGGLGSIAGIQQGTNDASLNLDTADARMRLQNEQGLMNVNNQVAATQRDLFQKNIRDKHTQDYGYAMRLKGQGNQNMFGGLDQLLGAGQYYAASKRPGYGGGYGGGYQQYGPGYLPPNLG